MEKFFLSDVVKPMQNKDFHFEINIRQNAL